MPAADRPAPPKSSSALQFGLAALCALLAFVLLGYHPYAEDGSIYSSAIAARIDPSLFPLEHAWVAAHTRLALFVPLTALLFRWLHLPLEVGLMLVQLAGLAATVLAVRSLAWRCFQNRRSVIWAVIAFVIGAGLPVAGTSLYLVDPYVTARSLTTPLLLWSVVWLVERRFPAAAACWVLAALLHPLMAFWSGVTIALFACLRLRWRAGLVVLPLLLLCGTCVVFALSPSDPSLVHTLAMSRSYWFLSQWQWYEIFGAIAPCAILACLGLRSGVDALSQPARQIVVACCCGSATAIALALTCARQAGHSTIVARCQPLRTLHLVFALFLVIGAGWLGRASATRRMHWPALGIAVAAALGVLWMQLSLYPDSAHLELPGLSSHNDWVDAFTWVRWNTPSNALFALDADYIDLPREDAQGFRGAALRSVLPDRVKDGGIASVMVALAEDWRNGVEAQAGIQQRLTPGRIRRLEALGVTWVVADPTLRTSLRCPYWNKTVAVCQLPHTALR